MKFLMNLIVLVMLSFILKAQSPIRPTTLPSPKSNGYAEIGYYRHDSGLLSGQRDTAWRPPAGLGAKTTWQNKYWRWDLDSLKWNLESASGSPISFTRQQYPYGYIYNSNVFYDTSDFRNTTNTTTSIDTSRHLIIGSSGSDSMGNVIRMVNPTLLENFSISATFKILTTGRGIGFGLSGQNSLAQIGLNGFVQTTGANSGKAQLATSSTANSWVTQSIGSAISLSAGDTVTILLSRVDSIVTLSVTKGASTSISTFTYTLTDVSVLLPNTAYWGVWCMGGSYAVHSLQIQTSTVKNATLMCVGDSKTAGYFATYFAYRFANILNNVYGNVVCNGGGSDRTDNVIARLTEIKSLHPERVLLNIGSNDKRSGVPYSQWAANYDYIVNNLVNGGIKVFHLLQINEPVLNFDDYNRHIILTYPSSQIVYPGIVQQSPILGGFHPDSTGNRQIADSVISQIGSQLVTPAKSIISANSMLDILTGADTSAIRTWSANRIIQASSVGNPQQVPFGRSGYQRGLTQSPTFVFDSTYNDLYLGTSSNGIHITDLLNSGGFFAQGFSYRNGQYIPTTTSTSALQLIGSAINIYQNVNLTSGTPFTPRLVGTIFNDVNGSTLTLNPGNTSNNINSLIVNGNSIIRGSVSVMPLTGVTGPGSIFLDCNPASKRWEFGNYAGDLYFINRATNKSYFLLNDKGVNTISSVFNNKDSTPLVSSIGTGMLMVIDTITGQEKRIRASSLTATVDTTTRNTGIPNFGRSINLSDSISKINSPAVFRLQTRGNILSDNFARASIGGNYSSAAPNSTITFPSSAYMSINGGTNAYTNYVEYDQYYTSDNKYTSSIMVIPQTISGDSVGLGTHSVNTNFASSITAVYSLINGTITLYGNEGFAGGNLLSRSTTSIVISALDSIRCSIQRLNNIFYAKMINVTTGTSVTVTYEYVYLNTITQPNIGRFRIYQFGGINNFSNLSADIDNLKTGIVFTGNSILEGQYSLNLRRWCDIVAGDNWYSIVGGPGERSSHFLLNIDNIIALNPKYCIVAVGANDVLGGVSVATYLANLNSGIALLKAAGITIILVSPPPSKVDPTLYVAAAASAASTNSVAYADIFAVLKQPADYNFQTIYNSGDSVHPNTPGMYALGKKIINTAPYLNTYTAPLKVPTLRQDTIPAPYLMGVDYYGNTSVVKNLNNNTIGTANRLAGYTTTTTLGSTGLGFNGTSLTMNSDDIRLTPYSISNYHGFAVVPQTTNAIGSFRVQPSGIAKNCDMELYATSDMTNYERSTWQYSAGVFNLRSEKNGSSVLRPLTFGLGGTELFRLDTTSGGLNSFSLPARYLSNLGSSFTTRSIIDKGYSDSAYIGISGNQSAAGNKTFTGNILLPNAPNALTGGASFLKVNATSGIVEKIDSATLFNNIRGSIDTSTYNTGLANIGRVKKIADSLINIRGGLDSAATVTITTTDASPTTILTIPIETNAIYGIQYRTVARKNATQSGYYNSALMAGNSGGAASILDGGSTDLFSPLLTLDLISTSVTATTSGNNILIQVNGVAATTIAWKINMNFVKNK